MVWRIFRSFASIFYTNNGSPATTSIDSKRAGAGNAAGSDANDQRTGDKRGLHQVSINSMELESQRSNQSDQSNNSVHGSPRFSIMKRKLSGLRSQQQKQDIFISIVRKHVILTMFSVLSTIFTLIFVGLFSLPYVFGGIDVIFNIAATLLMFSWNKKHYDRYCKCFVKKRNNSNQK